MALVDIKTTPEKIMILEQMQSTIKDMVTLVKSTEDRFKHLAGEQDFDPDLVADVIAQQEASFNALKLALTELISINLAYFKYRISVGTSRTLHIATITSNEGDAAITIKGWDGTTTEQRIAGWLTVDDLVRVQIPELEEDIITTVKSINFGIITLDGYGIDLTLNPVEAMTITLLAKEIT